MTLFKIFYNEIIHSKYNIAKRYVSTSMLVEDIWQDMHKLKKKMLTDVISLKIP